MNKEEKKAVEFVKKRTKELKKYAKRENELCYDDIVLNLIERLQKENEELENENKYLRERESYLEKRREDIINLFQNQQTATTIPKQKIKDKIEKLNDKSHAEELEDTMIGENYTITELVQYVLQELIEERKEK